MDFKGLGESRPWPSSAEIGLCSQGLALDSEEPPPLPLPSTPGSRPQPLDLARNTARHGHASELIFFYDFYVLDAS